MVKVDTLCLCLRLAPVGLLLAVHCSEGGWPSDSTARNRALRYGFSVELFPEHPLSVLTHIFVHVSTQHLLSNIFSLASTLMEFGGEDTMRDNMEEDDVAVAASRSLGSLVVMTLGGVLGGLGGQLLYNKSKVAKRKEEAQRLLSEQRKVRARDREKMIVGEPKKGMSKIRKPNMSRLWTDEGSIVATSLLGNKSRAEAATKGKAPAEAASEAAAAASNSSSSSRAAAGDAGQPASPPSPQPRRREAATIAEAYTASLRERIIHKMRGFISPEGDSGDPSGTIGSADEAGDIAPPSSSASSSSVSGNFITRAFQSASLSFQAWSATKAAQAQELLNRNMLMCGASAGICALSGFNLTYYGRPITSLCLALPEILIVGHELFLSGGASLPGGGGGSSPQQRGKGGAAGITEPWRTLLPGQVVGHAAHVGGFFVGCAMGCVWRYVAPLNRERGRQRKAEKRRRQREEEERAASQQWHARPNNNNNNSDNGNNRHHSGNDSSSGNFRSGGGRPSGSAC